MIEQFCSVKSYKLVSNQVFQIMDISRKQSSVPRKNPFLCAIRLRYTGLIVQVFTPIYQ